MRIILSGSESSTLSQKSWIEERFDADVQLCHDLGKLMQLLSKAHWDLVIMNLEGNYYPAENLGIVKESKSKPHIIAISEDADKDVIEAMRIGVSDYLASPVDKEKLLGSIQRFFFENKARRDDSENKKELDESREKPLLTEEVLFDGSAKMMAIKQVVDKILDADLPILITGESGTGKEMVAHYIHSRSQRNGPFVKVNCAAIPSELLESELFGYERGAFTGAYRRKPGKFEAADKGFLFLDEISELSYPLQSKLLHVLQDGTVSTLGSTREVPVDVRILAATNQNLEECVRKGIFRDDLYFRLNVVHLNIPPLRERLDHLASLIDYFSEKFAAQYNKQPVQLSPEARSFLYTYPWPGNIRELENALKRTTVLGSMSFLEQSKKADQQAASITKDTLGKEWDPVKKEQPHDLNKEKTVQGKVEEDPVGEANSFQMGQSLKEIAKEAVLQAEREAIARVLQQTRWNRKKTAKILDVSYKTLLTKIKETGLDEN